VVDGGSDVLEAVKAHQEWIADEVLATELVVGNGGTHGRPDMTAVDLDGIEARVSITRTN